jgi:hypothetical protein
LAQYGLFKSWAKFQASTSATATTGNATAAADGTWESTMAATGGRRWTFFESGKTPRGAQRGLAAMPYLAVGKTKLRAGKDLGERGLLL